MGKENDNDTASNFGNCNKVSGVGDNKSGSGIKASGSGGVGNKANGDNVSPK